MKQSCKIGEEVTSVDNVAAKRWGCYVKLHRLPFFASDSKLVFTWDNYTFSQYMRWKWYFRYRAAMLQVQHPKQAVEIIEFHWNLSDKEIEKIAYKNKLVAARATLTKLEDKVAAFVANWNLLFPYENEPSYQAALLRIEAQKVKVQELEAINEQLK